MGASYRSVHLHHGLWRGEVQLQGKRYRTARCTTAKVAALLRDVLLYKLQNEAAPLQIGLSDSQKRWILATNLTYLLQLVKSENDTLASLQDAAAGIEPTMLFPRLRTLSGEGFSESPSDEMAFEYLHQDHTQQEEDEYGEYGGPVRGNSDSNVWGGSQPSGSQALEALLSAAASAATQLQEEQTTQQQPSPPLPPMRPSLLKNDVLAHAPVHQRADMVQSMSREALQAALLEAYATMDAMETQLTTLEQQLGMKYTDTPPRRVFATRSSCTQPLQPLPPPPLPLYTASTMSSQPLPTASSTTAAQPPCRSVSMPSRIPTEYLHPTTMQALVSTAALAVDPPTSSATAPAPPIVPQARPASVVAPPVPTARPPPAIAFKAVSGTFQPYHAQSYNTQSYNTQPYNAQPYNAQPYNAATTHGCKRPLVELTAMSGCVLPGMRVGDGWSMSVPQAQDSPAKRIRLTV